MTIRESASDRGAVMSGRADDSVEFRDCADKTLGEPHVRAGDDFVESLAESPMAPSFSGDGMTGAQVFAKLCREEGLAALFCAPGNYAVMHAIAATGIPSYGGRTEGSMCSAADGFYRASGEISACSGTEGPGFAHMLMGIGAASAARTPLLVLASNATVELEDREHAIQYIYQQPITTIFTKYGKRIITPKRVHEYGAYAFRQLKCGVPGPVHLDFPNETSYARFTGADQLSDYHDKSRYRSDSVAAPGKKEISQAVQLIRAAERPLVIAGHGVFHRSATQALIEAAEKNDLPVVVTGPNRGHFPDDHRLSANLSSGIPQRADLVIFVGQYSMPSPPEYQISKDVKAIRIHPIAEDLGRNWPLDLGIVSDEREFLEALSDALPRRTRESWIKEVQSARRQYEEELDDHYRLGLKHSQNGNVHPAVIGREIYEFFFNGEIDPAQTVTGWGGFTAQRFIPPRLRAHRPGQSIITMYQFGATGVDVPMMVGATAAVKEGVGAQRAYKGAPVVVSCSDADMGYGMFELETAAKYKLPLIAIVYNNNSWGSWITADDESPRSLQLHLFSENIRYDRMAEGLGVHGEYVRYPRDLPGVLKRCYEIAARQSLPSLINIQAIREFTSGDAYPPGRAVNPEPGIGSHYH